MAIQDCVSQPIAGTSCRVPLYEGSALMHEPRLDNHLADPSTRSYVSSESLDNAAA
jgi:hypothetical protein